MLLHLPRWCWCNSWAEHRRCTSRPRGRSTRRAIRNLPPWSAKNGIGFAQDMPGLAMRLRSQPGWRHRGNHRSPSPPWKWHGIRPNHSANHHKQVISCYIANSTLPNLVQVVQASELKTKTQRSWLLHIVALLLWCVCKAFGRHSSDVGFVSFASHPKLFYKHLSKHL